MKIDLVCERKGPELVLRHAQDVWKATEKYHRCRKEHLLVLTVDGANQIIATRLVSIGLANRTMVHPREIFHKAICDGAVSVVLVHNHPSGSLEPSSEDRDVTLRVKQAGEILGIKLLDHVIVSTKGYYSFKEQEALL